MTDIPEDVLEAAREAVASQWETYPNEFILNMAKELRAGKRNCLSVEIASRAIMADRAAQAERMARLEEALTKIAERVETAVGAGVIEPGPNLYGTRSGHIQHAVFSVIETARRALSQEGSDA